MSKKSAEKHNEEGLEQYNNWRIDDAVASFEQAIAADDENPDYHMNLARAYVRNGSYDQAMVALGNYLHYETETVVAERYERLFSSALDEIETILIEKMQELGMDMQQIGKGIQMWLEYRITIGRQPLRIPKPELWAAGIAYTISKVNFGEIRKAQVSQVFGVSERAVRDKYNDIVEALDLMPADYRYFTGEKNPLDKMVEAAQLLDNLDEQFRADD